MNSESAACDRRDTIGSSIFNHFFQDESTDQQRLLSILLKTVEHFFGDFRTLFSNVTDPRNPQKTVYDMAALAVTGVLMFLLRLESRRQVGWLMRTPAAVKTFNAFLNVPGVPHGDTLNAAFRKSDPWDFQHVICDMHRRLIVSKSLNQYRLLDKYFVVAADGTGTLSFEKRHCKHCITRTHNGITHYYHAVLEAKLVTPNGFALSLMTEFVENPGPKPKKQDCELKAFYRLARNLKAVFPRLPIVLSLDGLYANGPTFSLCQKYGWGYVIVLTDEDLPSVNEEFECLRPLQAENRLTLITGKKREIRQEFSWVEAISYTDTGKKEHCLNVIECLETKPDGEGTLKTTKFKWVTNLRTTKSNVATLAKEGGRSRWIIEEGFNIQKNGGYELEHSYTTDYIAAKVFYYLLQIAHTIAQLINKGSLFKKAFPKGLGSEKNLAFRLLEALRNTPFSKNLFNALSSWHIQIRFGPDTS